MSSLTLLGDTSGSVVLDAPPISGSTVITLAAQSGTLNVGGPAFSAYIGSTQSIGGSTWTKMQCNTEEFDTNSNYDTSNYRFTPTVAGYYQVSASMNCSPANNFAAVAIYKNGSIYKQGANGGPSVNSSIVSTIVYLNGTTDYIEAYAIQGSGTTLTPAGISYNYFNGCFLRGA